MADDTPVQPENGKNISVTRMSVGTAEVKDMHVDLLTAVKAAIEEQTVTISKQNENIVRQSQEHQKQDKKSSDEIVKEEGQIVKAIQKLGEINQELIASIRTSGGGGEGGSEPGLSQAELKATQQGIEVVTLASKANGDFTNTVEALNKLWKSETQVVTASIVDGFVKTGRSLLSFRTAVDRATETFEKTLELSKSGMADFSDLFFDSMIRSAEYLANGFESSSDDLRATADLIKGSLQSGLVSPMVLVGGNLKDTATAFHDFRNDLEAGGLDLYKNLGFAEQNEVIAKLLDAQLRGDRMTDINDSTVRRQTYEQIATLRLIAENTGQSLDELITSNDTALTLAELENSGALTSEEASRILPALTELQNKNPELAKDYIQAFGAGKSRAAFEAFNKDMSENWRKQNIDLFSSVQGFKSKGTSAEVYQAMVDVGREQNINFREKGVGAGQFQLGGDYARFRTMASASNILKDLQEGMGSDSVVTRAFNQFQNWYTNKMPAFDAVQLIGSIGLNTAMLVGNTSALVAMTMALSPTGLFAKSMGTIFKYGAKLLKIGGAAMIAKDVYDVATGDASGENIGGVLGGAIGGGLGAFAGPLAPLAIPAGMMIGNMAGNFIGSQFDNVSAPVAGSPPAPPALSMPQFGGASAGGALAGSTAIATNSVSQTRLLENIAGSLHKNNQYQQEIRDRIGFGASGGGPTQRDSTKKGNNIALVPGRLGS